MRGSRVAPESQLDVEAVMKRFPERRTLWALAAFGLVLLAAPLPGQRFLNGVIWPEPTVVTPGEGNAAPSDAIVLFDGKNFDAWDGAKDWKVDEDGGFTAKGGLQTRKSFGDCQLHVEFASPKEV